MTPASSPRVLLVDASPYIFRAHFALPSSIVARDGRPANATYGFGSFLLKLLADESPTHLGVAFDESLTTSFRNDLYPEYKRQRELPPADLEDQLADCRELASAFGAATFVDERHEADDLIATVCARLQATAGEGVRISVVTSDKDLSQLVGRGVEWFDYGKAKRYSSSEVVARFGVPPARIPDLLGLAGDPVDNIPGVPGIGSKTALALFDSFGGAATLEDLLERADEVAALPLRGSARIARLLTQHRDSALLSKRLATVVRDVPLSPTLADLELRPPDRAALDSLCERLGFESLRERALARADAC